MSDDAMDVLIGLSFCVLFASLTAMAMWEIVKSWTFLPVAFFGVVMTLSAVRETGKVWRMWRRP